MPKPKHLVRFDWAWRRQLELSNQISTLLREQSRATDAEYLAYQRKIVKATAERDALMGAVHGSRL